ncbi:Fasciclin-like arabinogalactan protein 2 [Acorus calamus]|uniref:Fasciclin-like arabinogalactan protein 2 n=1 Tax=Acorus calamus TaxID=4465 RepID=A0AAV9CTP2_ACOCL|nr:Fasciclin-like arabinogalactan protein 2 [Acorus calamus]
MKNLLLAATLLLFMSAASPLTDAANTPRTRNITKKILNQYPQFLTFNHYLTTTHLAVEINQRQTITHSGGGGGNAEAEPVQFHSLDAEQILAVPEVEMMFESNLDGGLTIFCQVDNAITAFMPKFMNLTKDQQIL